MLVINKKHIIGAKKVHSDWKQSNKIYKIINITN